MNGSFHSPWFAVSLGLLGVILGFGIATYVGSPGRPSPAPTLAPTAAPPLPQPPPPPQPPPAARNASELIDDDAMMGDGDAPLTIVEWSDYQCTFCKRFRDQTLDQIKSQYIDTGKVKFVYRDFPLDSIHPNARPAAIASECAGDEGKFWEFHDKLFETQQQWSNSPSAKDLFKQYGTELGIDIADCIVGNMYDGEVSKDLADGSANGVSGTPAFIVGNQYLSGAQPFERFKAVIEAQLRE